ncbi:TonB-dependent receptor [Novosphingobium sp. SG707]|uniref:TonB-dependent receptor plug domain-containing protein n=1 Tax=Novosphingobium sp. SG707 TaxID=2586996 RepID=UPI001446C5BA|nr:TonB-dependent receptor [Novosphingobium sp. SG707]NKJ02730.1 iron complex outermembrane receptor protein [Novosphingobium sp. SG707]
MLPARILPLLAATTLATPALAQDQSASFALGQIVVSAQPPKDLEITSERLSAKAIETFGRVTLDDAMALAPGVSAGNSGGTRNERLIFVRGFNRFQVPLSVDGIRVYLPADNRLDFGRFLTNDIAEVQIAKGYVSVLNGPDGMGGAINLVTAKPTRELEAEVGASLNLGRQGEYAGYSANALIGTRHDKWYAQGSFGRNYTDHWDLAGGYASTANQPAGRRNLSQSGDWRVNVKAGFTPNATDEYVIAYTRQEGQKLAPLHITDPVSSQRFWTWPAWNTESLYFLSNTALGEIGTLKTRLYRNNFYNMLRAWDNANENTQTLGRAFNSPYWDEALGGSGELTLRPSARERISIAFQMRSDRHREAQTSFPSGAVEPVQTTLENTYSLALEHAYQFTPALSLTLGGGYDWRDLKRAEEYGAPLGTSGASVLYNYPMRNTSAWSGQGRLDWAVNADTRLHVSLSSRARFPTIFERFSQRFGTSIPNPGLKPERARQIEVGGSTRLGAVKLEAAAFHALLSNAIVSESVLGYACTASTTPGNCAQSVMTQSLNVARGKYYGVELAASAQVLPSLALGGNYTWVHRDLVDPGNAVFRPTDVPSHKAFAYADWTPISRFHLIPSADIASSRWTVTSAAPIRYYRTGAYVNAAIKAEVELRKGISIAASARNLFDANYQLVDGFPEAGRSYQLSLRASY